MKESAKLTAPALAVKRSHRL